MSHTIEIDESQRQLILLALGCLALLRPGFDYALGEAAERLGGREMYAEFKRLNADTIKPQFMHFGPKT